MKRKRGRDKDEKIFEDFLLGTRAVLNRQSWELLYNDKDFLAELEKIRKLWKVPADLQRIEDAEIIWTASGDVIESRWLHGFGSQERMTMDVQLESLLNKYKLPSSFFDFLQHIILYRELPTDILLSPFTSALISDITVESNNINRVPLSSDEKRFLLAWLRHRLGIKTGRIPKKYADIYGRFSKFLATSKNKLRRLRTLTDTLRAIEAKNKLFIEIDTSNESNENYETSSKKTYRDVADELNPNLPISKTNKVATRLRQRVSRLKKRTNKGKN